MRDLKPDVVTWAERRKTRDEFGREFLLMHYPRFRMNLLRLGGDVRRAIEQLILYENQWRDGERIKLLDFPPVVRRGKAPPRAIYTKKFLGAMAYEICTNYSFKKEGSRRKCSINWSNVRAKLLARNFPRVSSAKALESKFRSLRKEADGKVALEPQNMDLDEFTDMKLLYEDIFNCLSKGKDPDLDSVMEWEETDWEETD